MSTIDVDAGLVPLVDRVRGLQLTRAVLAVVAVVIAAVAEPGTVGRPGPVAALAAAYLAVTAVSLRAPALRRSAAILLSGAALLVDGVFLAAVTYAVAGFDSPVWVLVVLHCVGVTMLASFRTGLKVAMWHTLVASSVFELQRAGVLGTGEPAWRLVALAVGAVWVATLATATFAAVNEREIRRRNYDLAALSRFSLRLEASMRPTDVGQALIDAVCADQGVERAVLLGAVGPGLERIAGHGDAPVPPDAPGAADDEMVARAVAAHRVLRVPALDPVRDPWLSAALPDVRNLLLVPVYADGAITAVLAAEHGAARGSRVALRAQSMLERYASHAGLVMANARLLARMRSLADTDGLTGVANRRTFDATLVEELMVATAQRVPISLVMVDLDHFKRLNDTLGHQVGDAVLQQLGQVLRAACRPTDLVARYGGEEFAVIAPRTDATNAAALGERLRAAVATIAAAGPPGSVTASFGVGTCPDGNVAARELVGLADRALYRSKEAGRDRVTVAVTSAPAPVG